MIIPGIDRVASWWEVRGYFDAVKKFYHGKFKVVFTNGCFDLLHPGHVECLKFARNQGDALVVGLNSDSSVRRLKGPARPIVGEKDRATVLAAVRYVDFVTVFEEETPEELIHAINPDVLVKGSEYRGKHVAGMLHVVNNGGRMEYFDMVPQQSTTSIFERVVAALSRDDLVDELNVRE